MDLLEKQSVWPSWKLPELTSEILNQLQNERKQSRIITMNVNPGWFRYCGNTFVWNEEAHILSLPPE